MTVQPCGIATPPSLVRAMIPCRIARINARLLKAQTAYPRPVRTCPSCRRENVDGARFCISCGTALIVHCGECGAEVPPEADFCPACGAQVAPSPLPAGEERKVVTVLFADLVDWTGNAEQLDPEDVRGLQLPYFERARTEIERFGGTLEKFIGDAVMAVFGAPTVHEDDPERAVRAALAVRDAVGELNELAEGVELHVRIGVNTGEAMVALGADAGAGEGLVTGDVVNTCSRLEAAAPVDGILVGETTYRATAAAVDYGDGRRSTRRASASRLRPGRRSGSATTQRGRRRRSSAAGRS